MDTFTINALLIELTVEVEVATFGANRDGRNGRDSVVTKPVVEVRRLPPGAPSLADRGNQHKP